MVDLVVIQGCETLQLTRGQNALIDSRDSRALNTHKWFALPSHGTYYAARSSRSNSGKKQTIRVHRVVLETHVGPCPDGLECRHINGDSLDDRSENLAWGTHSENAQDGMRHGTWKGAFRPGEPNPHTRGERNASARLKPSDIPEIRRRRASGETQMSLARSYGVSHAAIQKILNGKSWSHVGSQSLTA